MDHAGKISATAAKSKAELEYVHYRALMDLQPRMVDADFEKVATQIEKFPKPKATRPQTMIPSNQTVAGIDVGGKKKGFHAIALSNGVFEKTTSTSSSKIVDWCLERNASVIAVDAPCGWSQSGSSRLAERTLEMAGAKIQCFATPTYADAKAHQKGFYDWVFNGEELYQQLTSHFPLFDGKGMKNQVCFETFPHAIVCALAAKVVPAKLKTSTRRDVLRKLGYDVSILTNVDFIDAALCAVAAVAFSAHLITKFGAPNDGFIVVPSIDFADPVKR